MQIKTRAIQINDEQIWRSLFFGYLQTDGSTLPEEVLSTTFARLCDPNPHEFNGLFALVDDQPVGFVHFLNHRNTWSVQDSVYIQDLFVDPTARKQGVGEHLIKSVFEHADKTGTPHVYWMTQANNLTAQSLYDKIADNPGYIKYQRK